MTNASSEEQWHFPLWMTKHSGRWSNEANCQLVQWYSWQGTLCSGKIVMKKNSMVSRTLTMHVLLWYFSRHNIDSSSSSSCKSMAIAAINNWWAWHCLIKANSKIAWRFSNAWRCKASRALWCSFTFVCRLVVWRYNWWAWKHESPGAKKEQGVKVPKTIKSNGKCEIQSTVSG